MQHDSNSRLENNKTAKQSFSLSKEIKYSVPKNSSIFSVDYYEFLKKILMILQKPALTLLKIKQLMCSKFEGLHDFPLETLRLALRNKVKPAKD